MSKKTKTKKHKHFEPHYLLIILVVVLLLEGFLVSNTTSADWQQGFAILDMGPAVSDVISDTSSMMQPIMNTVESVTIFYHESAKHLYSLLDLSGNNPANEVLLIAGFTSAFYERAADELIELLDFSSSPINIAEASFIRF